MAKKLLCVIVLILALIYTLASCDNKNANESPNTSENQSHTHSYGEWIPTKAATCTTDGIKERYCSCGEKQTAAIPMTEHIYSEWKIVKEATLTEKGSESRICSCGNTETRDIDILSVVTTITENEWKSAFDLSKYSSITVIGSEKGSEDGIDFDFNTTIKYYGGLLSIDSIGSGYNGEDSFISYEATTLKSFYDFGTLGLSMIEWLLSDYEELNDFGYSKITYFESEKYYQAVSEYGEIYKFWFENGRLVKYSCENNSQGEYLFCTYTFTDINSTEKFNVPISTIKNEYQQIVNSIASNTKFYYYDDNWNTVYVNASEIKDILNSLKIEIIESYGKGLSNGNIQEFYLKTSTMSSVDKPLKLDVRESKIYEIAIGSSYEDSIYYYVEN